MTSNHDVEDLIRRALLADGVNGPELTGETSLPDMVTEVYRGRLRWFAVLFTFMIAVFSVVTVVCGIRFFQAEAIAEMLRWGVGFVFGFAIVISGKIWYWMETGRLAMTREIKRLELLVVHLATELRERG